MTELKAQALAVYQPEVVAARGYITPAEELSIRQLQLSYWKARNALFELVVEIWRDIQADRPRDAAAVSRRAGRGRRCWSTRPASSAKLSSRRRRPPQARRARPGLRHSAADVRRRAKVAHRSLSCLAPWHATRYYDQHHAEFRQAATDDRPRAARGDHRPAPRSAAAFAVDVRADATAGQRPADDSPRRPRRARPRRVRRAGGRRPRHGRGQGPARPHAPACHQRFATR